MTFKEIPMNMRLPVVLLSILLALSAGCSSKSAKELDARLESAQSNALSAKARADEAYSKAEQAAVAANQAQQTADQANERASRVLEKASRK
jgi:outer membrane murein-binding lipoprotein Lpp